MRARSLLHRRFARENRGSVAVEFAIISPVMLVMLGGIYEIGHAFQALTAVNELASQYAISWADCSDNPTGTCNTELTQYNTAGAISNVAPTLTASGVTVQMYQVKMSGTTPAVQYPTGGSLTAAQISAAQTSLQSGDTGVVVTVNYTYTVSLFGGFLSGVIPNSIPMSYTTVQLKA